MRSGMHYAPSSVSRPCASPSPALNVTSSSNPTQPTLVSFVFALFLPCAGMSLVLVVYLSLLWWVGNGYTNQDRDGDRLAVAVKAAEEEGLSATELENLPKMTGKELVRGTECAVCLEEVDREQPARLLPGCNHGFHLQCADTWLSKHSVCPMCRARLDSHSFTALDNTNSPC